MVYVSSGFFRLFEFGYWDHEYCQVCNSVYHESFFFGRGELVDENLFLMLLVPCLEPLMTSVLSFQGRINPLTYILCRQQCTVDDGQHGRIDRTSAWDLNPSSQAPCYTVLLPFPEVLTHLTKETMDLCNHELSLVIGLQTICAAKL